MEEARVLASVNGVDITERDVAEALYAMGPRGRDYMTPEGQKQILEELINRRLLLASAKRELLEFDPAFKAELARAKDELLTRFAIRRAVEGVRVSDDKVKAYYEAHRGEWQSGETVRASHILVDSREKAESIRQRLLSGALSFEDAARAESTCPSREQGGDLGVFGRGQMVKEFEDAAFSLAPGEISEPVETQFGWHLIRVAEKSDGGEVSFEQIREQLKEQLLAEEQQKAYESKINQLKILFPVDRF